MLVRTTSYSLPEELHSHIELIQPTTYFSSLKGMASTLRISEDPPEVTSQALSQIEVPSAYKGLVDVNCNYKITISCLQQLYNTVGYKPSAKNGNKIAVTGYLDFFASFSDLQQFYRDQRKDAVGSNFTVIFVNGSSFILQFEESRLKFEGFRWSE